MSNIMDQIGPNAKQAAYELGQLSAPSINNALNEIATAIENNMDSLLSVNANEVENAKDKGQTSAIIDRLTLTPDRISAIANSVRAITDQADPINRVLETKTRPNGLIIEKKSVPLGVLGIIYEARPNVTVDAAALCLKSHNAVILRGGSECFKTAYKLYEVMRSALANTDIPQDAIQMIPDTDRTHVGNMLSAIDYIDVIVPRGGKGLTARVQQEAKMPVFSHLDGICHTYIHSQANADMAVNVALNAKMRRTGICGATETILIDKDVPQEITKAIIKKLQEANCEIAGDTTIQSLASNIEPATEDDWKTEYLDAKVSIKTVKNIVEAINHINTYGSHHTDAIITDDTKAAEEFLNRVDSANVMHNCSTQYADGGEFGMGAEIGIATGKFHARGPVGAEQLTTYKYLVKGSGQTRP